MERESQIRPGARIDIVIDVDYIKEKIDVRRSIVYDIIEKNIILAQTNPPIMPRHIGSKIALTYLVRKDDEYIRHGFHTKIAEFIKDYTLSSSEIVQAIAVQGNARPEEFNVRMHYRVKPGIDSGLGLSLKGEKVNIIDISIGGTKGTHRKEYHIDSKKNVRGVLSVDGEGFEIEARILRVWETTGSKKTGDLEYFALQFLNLNRQLEDLLAKKVREIEREARLKEALP